MSVIQAICTPNDDTAQAGDTPVQRSMISVPIVATPPVARYSSDAERVEGLRLWRKKGRKDVLMCQLIARKLERIALNDRADVAGLKEGLRGEGKLEGLVSIFFSKDERGKYL